MKKTIINKIKNLNNQSLTDSKTRENVLSAFAGESQAYHRYKMYADIALEEGYHNIYQTFHEIAQNEKIHAQLFFSLLDGKELDIKASYPAGYVGTTIQNLTQSIQNENKEQLDVYPSFAETAENEGYHYISDLFLKIAAIEKHHAQILNDLKNRLANETLLKSENQSIWLCNECGHLHIGKSAPLECPTCHHSKYHYKYYTAL